MTPETTTNILTALATYYTLTRKMLQDVCDLGDDDRAVRKLLQQLVKAGLVARTLRQVINIDMGMPAPVFFPTRKGCDFLACATGEMKWLAATTTTPRSDWLYHWLDIARFRIILDRGVARQDEVRIENCLTEWQVANPDEKEAHKRYSLFTQLREKPRLVCAPDLGFMIRYRGFVRGIYGEIDRMTSTVTQIAASKTPGYAAMNEPLVARHFPEAAKIPIGVILVTPSAGRRDLLGKLIASKPGARLWKFACWDDITPATVLHEAVFRDCEGNAVPLIKRLPPLESDGAGSRPNLGRN